MLRIMAISATPAISIILPIYNGEKTIRKTLASVLAQSFTDFELLLLDDGSSDASAEIARKTAAEDSRVIFIQHSRNLGTGAAYIEMLRRAHGEWIAQLGQDDLWNPNFLAEMSTFISKKNVVAAFCLPSIIDENGNPIPKSIFQHEALNESADAVFMTLLTGNFLCAGSSLFRRSAIDPESMLPGNDQLQDWETWLRLSFRGKFALLTKNLMSYCVHPKSLSASGGSSRLVQLDGIHTLASCLESVDFWKFLAAKSPQIRAEIQDAISGRFANYDADELLLYSLRRGERLAECRNCPGISEWRGKQYARTGGWSRALKLHSPLTPNPSRAGTRRFLAILVGEAPKSPPWDTSICFFSILGVRLVFGRWAKKLPGFTLRGRKEPSDVLKALEAALAASMEGSLAFRLWRKLTK
jgi:glycosyltransferase involved in cell wall biosynthesis